MVNPEVRVRAILLNAAREAYGAPDERDEYVERPQVFRGCVRCRVQPNDVRDNRVIVSPTGVAHFGTDGGDTACGIDATDDRWWWPC
jgi:hypothetical protein